MSLAVGIAGGGSGGHIEPALNTADEFRARDPESAITVFGTTRGLEGTLVPRRGYALHTIEPVPLPRRPSKDLLLLPARLRRSVAQAGAILESERVDVVVGFGGYVSIPVYLAARRHKIPFVVHEANARPGLANRLGARLTPYVAENYAGSIKAATRVGCPLRPAIAGLDRGAARAEARRYFGLRPDGPVLLVFGGSQGAARINGALRAARGEIMAAGVQILHAVGPNKEEGVVAAPGYTPVEFIDRMDLAYAAADLAVCRSGAMTCAEVAAVGLPAIYVPYPVGNGEQRLNAAPVVAAGGGVIVEDGALTGHRLAAEVLPLIGDPERLARMGERAAGYGIRDGARRLVDLAVRAAGGGA